VSEVLDRQGHGDDKQEQGDGVGDIQAVTVPVQVLPGRPADRAPAF
jgi:hypothetical protein